MKPIREVLAEARLGCTYLNDSIGGSERIKYARVDADYILKALDEAGYAVTPVHSLQADAKFLNIMISASILGLFVSGCLGIAKILGWL